PPPRGATERGRSLTTTTPLP
ncbi:hypothetical protein, partial [Pseudomonas sp. HMWF011]